MQEPKHLIRTIFTKDAYRKFLYAATFKKSKLIWLYILLISMIAALIVGYNGIVINIQKTVISGLLFFLLVLVVLIVKVEVKYSQRIKSDNTGSFNSVTTLKFYENKLFEENESLKSSGEIKYSQFYSLVECKDLFIFYLTATQASLIKKSDITSNYGEFRAFIIDKFKGRYKKI